MKCFSFLLLCCWALPVVGQVDTGKVAFNGYVKDLRTIIIPGNDPLLTDNLLHNRLNFRWYPHSRWTIALEARNRVFYGQVVQSIPDYATLIQTDDYFDWSVDWVNTSSTVVHSVLDRGYVQYSHKKWEVTVGRQRINWGINTVWNPNDLFNAFSYVDFDYEERPGSDAVRIQHYYGFAGRVELAAKLADSLDGAVIAGLWRFNKGTYDFQVIGGIARGDITAGMGWAGHISLAGFKGELTYFHPYDGSGRGALSATLALDYAFANGTYLMVSGLYNSAAGNSPSSLLNYTPSAKNLSPYRYNIFTSVMHPFSPILAGNLAVIYAPENKVLFATPGITFSVATNWDFDVLGQIILHEERSAFGLQTALIFTRLKWSF